MKFVTRKNLIRIHLGIVVMSCFMILGSNDVFSYLWFGILIGANGIFAWHNHVMIEQDRFLDVIHNEVTQLHERVERLKNGR